MSRTNNTTKINKKQYHHLTQEQRAQIEILLNATDENGKRLFNNTYIAKAVGVDRSTISREIKRIKSKISVMTGRITNKPYNAVDAQNDYNYKRALSKAEYKLEKYPIMRDFIVNKIVKEK